MSFIFIFTSWSFRVKFIVMIYRGCLSLTLSFKFYLIIILGNPFQHNVDMLETSIHKSRNLFFKRFSLVLVPLKVANSSVKRRYGRITFCSLSLQIYVFIYWSLCLQFFTLVLLRQYNISSLHWCCPGLVAHILAFIHTWFKCLYMECSSF